MSTKKKVEKKTNNDIFLKIKNACKKIFIKVKSVVTTFLKAHWDILLLNLIISILTIFIESLMYKNLIVFSRIDAENILKLLNTIVFVALPTIYFTFKRNIKVKDLLISVPTLYILFLIFMDYCTLRELYGINSLGAGDIPCYIDALMVSFIFVLFEYIGYIIGSKLKNKNKKVIETKVKGKRKK